MKLNDLTPAEALDLGARILACGVRPAIFGLRYIRGPFGTDYRVAGGWDPDGMLDLRDAGTFGHVWEEYERRAEHRAWFDCWENKDGHESWSLNWAWHRRTDCLPTRAHALVAAFEALK